MKNNEFDAIVVGTGISGGWEVSEVRLSGVLTVYFKGHKIAGQR